MFSIWIPAISHSVEDQMLHLHYKSAMSFNSLQSATLFVNARSSLFILLLFLYWHTNSCKNVTRTPLLQHILAGKIKSRISRIPTRTIRSRNRIENRPIAALRGMAEIFLNPSPRTVPSFSSLLLSHSVSDSTPGRWNENVYRGTCALDLSFPAIPCFLINPPTSPDHPCHREAASEAVRATWCKSKREEKRTWSGSIRRASKRDAESEGDRGSGSNDVVEARGEKRKRKSGREGIQMWERWEVGNEKDEERQSHRAFPGPRLAT